MKGVKISNLVYEMLLVISKKRRLKPEECIEALIQQAFNGTK